MTFKSDICTWLQGEEVREKAKALINLEKIGPSKWIIGSEARKFYTLRSRRGENFSTATWKERFKKKETCIRIWVLPWNVTLNEGSVENGGGVAQDDTWGRSRSKAFGNKAIWILGSWQSRKPMCDAMAVLGRGEKAKLEFLGKFSLDPSLQVKLQPLSWSFTLCHKLHFSLLSLWCWVLHV